MPTDELDDKFADIYDKWTHYPDGQDTLYLSLQSTIPGEFVIPVDRLTHNIIHELSHAVTMPTIYNGGFVTIMDLKGAVLSSTDAIDSLIEGVPDPWEYATAMGNPSEFIAEAMTFEVLGQTDVMFGAYAAAPELEGYLDSFFDGDVPRAADKQLVGQLAFEKALARMLLCGTAQFPVQVDKHYGPGDHPSGSPQSVHGARLLRPVSGDSEALGKTYLVNPDGSSPNVSMDGLAELKVDKAGKVRKIPNATSSTIVTRIDETLAVYDMTRESMGENMQLVFDSAMARYEDHPELFEADKFYERWHEELFIISELHNRGFDDVIAAAAAISPGLDAAENLQYANELAQLVDDNHLFTPTEAGEIAAELADNADMIRNPVYTDKHEEVKLGLKQEGELRAPETGEARLAIASSLEKDVILLQSDGVKFLSLSNEGSARAAHWMRRQTFFNEAGDPVGFQTKSWSNFANAIEVLREDRLFTADDALRGIKTRSFYNNIVDPTNNFRRDDVTVDFHTINISAFGLGSDDNTHIQATPGLESVGLGIRPAVADAIRNVNTRGRVLHGSRVQEITWAEWRRGQGPRGSDTWTSYGGTVFELKDISSDPRKKT